MEPFENTDFENASGELRKERLNRFRKAHQIGVRGSDVPEPLISFGDLFTRYDLPRKTAVDLSTSGFHEPTPVQRQTIPLMLERRELLVCAPTGSGKTLAFLLPLLHHTHRLIFTSPSSTSNTSLVSPLAVVLAPTVELAMQTFAVCRKLTSIFSSDLSILMESCSGSIRQLQAQLKAEKVEDTMEGGRGEGRRKKALERRLKAKMENLARSLKGVHVLISTPQRLLDTLDTGVLSLDRVEWLVMDEADRLFDAKLGCRFRDQVARVFGACGCPQVRRALFSATTRPEVEEWARLSLDSLVSVRVGHRNAAASNVTQSLTYCGEESGKLHEMRMLMVRGLKFPCLIFLQSRDRARLLFEELAQRDIKAGFLSGDLSQKQREAVMSQFRQQQVLALVCTDLLSRGIDVPDVQMVVNYDLPPSPLEYVHRIGRTGRAGQRGVALTFWTDEDFDKLRPIAHVIREAGGTVPDQLGEFLRKSAHKSGRSSRKLHLPKRGDLKGRGSDMKRSKKKQLSSRINGHSRT